jgi:hypothetical protein
MKLGEWPEEPDQGIIAKKIFRRRKQPETSEKIEKLFLTFRTDMSNKLLNKAAEAV